MNNSLIVYIKFIIIITCSFVTFKPVIASNCIKDIVRAGVSFDSVVYNGTKNNSEASLASNLGYGIKGTWIVFCPNNNVEYGSYLRLRHFNFIDTEKITEYKGVPNSINLLSLGGEIKIPFNYNNELFEIPIDIELRQEMGFQGSGSVLNKNDYLNLKLMGGLRKFIWGKKDFDITGVLKTGLLLGLSDRANIGITYGISLEFLKKITNKSSFKFDLYYDLYNQGIAEIEMLRKELGLRTNLVIRL